MHIDEMRCRFDDSPCAKYMGMKLIDLSEGYAKVEMKVREEFVNWENMIQGGIIVTLLDQAFGCACNTLDSIYIAIQMNIHFLAAASVGETIYADSKVLRAGKKIGTSVITAFDSNGKTIAYATGATVCMGSRTK